MKTLTQVVEAKVVTQHGTGWHFTYENNTDIIFPFAWKREKLITSRDDHADWLFYQLWSNGNPGPRYACKVQEDKLVMVEFEKWDPCGGFRSTSGWTGQGHGIAVTLSAEEYESARKWRSCPTPNRDTLLIQLIAELAVK